jgi:hypothetical protein
MECLALGKLDAYLDSVHRTDKLLVPGIEMSTDANLLLHELGQRCDMRKITQLFSGGTVYIVSISFCMALLDMAPYRHLYNTSGSGKTRLSLVGLCHEWGLYLSFLRRDATGSRDLQDAILKVLPSISIWNKEGLRRLDDNLQIAEHVFAMVLCARVFVLRELVDRIPLSTNATTARRRWVLLQAAPPSFHPGGDIFVQLLRSIRGGETETMPQFISSTN